MSLVEYEVVNRVGYITLNRPEKRNALSPELIVALKEAFDKADQDENAKIVVLKANGEVFCAGADLAYLQKLQHYTLEENLEDSRNLMALFLQIYSLRKVVIAQVQGHALAGGCGLVTVCDYVFAVEEAKFGYTEVKIGFVPAIVMSFLIRRIGEGRARQLLLSGSQVKAKEAYALGLINCVSHKKMLDREVKEYTQYLVRTNSGASMSLTKKLLSQVASLSLEESLNLAAEVNAKARVTDDCKRGIQSFLEKKIIRW